MSSGFTEAPQHYAQQKRETIDHIRDVLGDDGFIAWCIGNVIKYEDRSPYKGADALDLKKADFYRQMYRHVERPMSCDDPRSNRSDYTPYQRTTP